MVGYGLCSILDKNSRKGLWAAFQIILAFGIALPVATLLPAVQASSSEEDTATSTGAWAFLRSYGSIFGAAIPAAVFNDCSNQLLGTITDEHARVLLSSGDAYARASPSRGISELSSAIRDQVGNVYSMSLTRFWQIGLVFSGVSFLLVFLEKDVAMRQELDTQFSLEKQENAPLDETNGRISL